MYLHDFGIKPRFSFEILILQASWLTVHLHVFAWFWDQTQVPFWDPDPPNQLVYSSFAWSWDQIHIDFAKRWKFSITCWHFHNFVGAGILGPNSILKISLFGSWSYKLPGLKCFYMILGLNPDSVLGSFSCKPPGLQCICMILELNLDSVFGSWSPKMRQLSI